MKTHPLLSLFAALLLPGMLHANDNVSTSTKNFVQTASVAGTFEIESGKLAIDKTKKANIRKFAQEMIDDHTRANEQLKATLPDSRTGLTATEALDAKHQNIIDKLKSASGGEFDRQYVAAQADAHNEAVELFSSYAQTGDNAILKEFAGRTLPTLQRHHNHVKELKSGQ